MAVKDIVEAVLAFNAAEVVDLVKAEIAADTAVEEILNTGLIGAMDIVGKKFSDGDLFVPEMLMAAQAMKAGLVRLDAVEANGRLRDPHKETAGPNLLTDRYERVDRVAALKLTDTLAFTQKDIRQYLPNRMCPHAGGCHHPGLFGG